MSAEPDQRGTAGHRYALIGPHQNTVQIAALDAICVHRHADFVPQTVGSRRAANELGGRLLEGEAQSEFVPRDFSPPVAEALLHKRGGVSDFGAGCGIDLERDRQSVVIDARALRKVDVVRPVEARSAADFAGRGRRLPPLAVVASNG